LQEDERAVLNPTDLQRFDRHPDHICCSVEYPNAWYLDRARSKERIFKDWIVLLLTPSLMLRHGTLFSPRNAAAGYGAYLQPGVEGFLEMYAPEITGAYAKKFIRRPTHIASVPTDQQAEVLVPGAVASGDILGVVVRDEEQARNEVLRLKLMGSAAKFRILISPSLFDKNSLDAHIRAGKRPAEVLFQIGEFDGK
jgi:hypothetical protein